MIDLVKEWAIFGSGLVVLIAGIVLSFIGIFIPPIGEIHASILTLVGEFLTFSGSALGIGSYTAIQIQKIKHSVKKEVE